MSLKVEPFEKIKSSSELTICDDNELSDYLPIDQYGNVFLFSGWKYNGEKNNALTKANYCAIAAYGDNEKTQMLINVIKSHTWCHSVTYEFLNADDAIRQLCYVDYGCYDEILKAFESKTKLMNFIFNPKSTIKH